MRVTTSTIMSRYSGRLNDVLSKLDKANETVTTRRKYNKASEDPSSSIQATRLRQDFLYNEDYRNNVADTQDWYDSVETVLMRIEDGAESAYVDVLAAINAPIMENPELKAIFATEMRELQSSLVKDLNTNYADKMLFGGSSTHEAPFVLAEDGTLTFRGIDVNTTDPDELAKLDALANEKIYVNLGFDLSVQSDGTVDPSSAHNISFPGIAFLGYGMDDNGNPKNLITNLGALADLMDDPDATIADIEELAHNLDRQHEEVLTTITKLGANSMFLDYTSLRLEDNYYSLNERIDDTEYVDLEEAITNFKMLDYTYKATLQVGTDILTPSFIDFMN